MLHVSSAPSPPTVDRLQAVLLDRDGVINVRRVDHVTRWEDFVFLPGVKAAIAKLTALRLPVFIVTNQAAINRGLVSHETVGTIHDRMRAEVAAAGGIIADIACCPHRPDEACSCRKPAPGMLRSLAARHRLDLSRCLMAGDTCGDLRAGKAAGCRTALVLTGQGYEEHVRAQSLGLRGFTIAANLSVLVRWIEHEFFTPTYQQATYPAIAPAAAD